MAQPGRFGLLARWFGGLLMSVTPPPPRYLTLHTQAADPAAGGEGEKRRSSFKSMFTRGCADSHFTLCSTPKHMREGGGVALGREGRLLSQLLIEQRNATQRKGHARSHFLSRRYMLLSKICSGKLAVARFPPAPRSSPPLA